MPNSDYVRARQVQLFAPGLLDALVERETRLRIDYRSIPAAPEESARNFVRASTAFIELVYVSSVFVEMARRQGAETIRDAIARGEEIDQLVRSLTRLNPYQVLRENAGLLDESAGAGQPALEQSLPELGKVVSAADSTVRACPVAELVDLAIAVGIHEFGARCQVALDGLSRFIKRNDPWIDQRLKVLGPDYSSGRLSLEDVAHVLGLSVYDAVALLEDFGFARSLDHISLSEERRNDLYHALRRSRLARDRGPTAVPARIVRDVVATQRIESVDARPWIDPKLM